MKKIMELVIGVIMMAMVANCFTGNEKSTENTEITIMEELKQEGWTDIYVEPTEEEDNTYAFTCETEIDEKSILVRGTLTYDDGLVPVEMTAYGIYNGTLREIGEWDILNDWTYTEFGEEYMRTVRHYTN